ncbi:MAG: SO_0444 family Cu/Zn efflux transporter [Planctomycetota bacterium]|nr:SO_0444 family Cu/Zn efflux transporter [Planctomycetota bacterium]
MGTFLVDWIQALWMILVESGPYLLAGFVIAGFLSVVVPATWIARKLGGNDVRSVATAAIIGVPVPLCSCSVIPTATQLRRSGASRGATTSFLISTPETGVDSIGATWALMDPLMTVVRPIAAFLTAFVSGVAVNVFGRESKGPSGPLDTPGPSATDASCCSHGETAAPAHAHAHAHDHGHAHGHGHDHDHDHDHDSSASSLPRRVLRYAFGTLLDDLAPWFLIGFAISGLIVVAVPDDFFTGTLFDGWVAMVAMLFAGVPLYVCATASTPIAAAMMAKGLAPGAALVFLLAGPATNVATILVVRDLLGRRVLAIYLTSIAGLSLLLGAVVNRLYPAFGLDPRAMDVSPDAMDHGPIATAAGAVLAVLLVRSGWRLRLDRRFGAWLRRSGAHLGLDPTAPVVRAAALLLAVVSYASTAITVVGPGEAVFVERFGRVVSSADEPGALTHLPWPFDRIERVDAGALRTARFGVAENPIPDDAVDVVALKRLRAELQQLEDEAEMMTGDETTLVAVQYAVQYRVADPACWLYEFSDPEALLRRLAQEALRRVVAERTVEEVLNDPEADLASGAEAVLAERLAAAALGAELVRIDLLSAHAPPGVHAEYRGVASAMVDAEKELLLENRRAATSEAEARMDAASTVTAARASQVLDLARAEGVAAARGALAAANQRSLGSLQHVLALESMKRAFTPNADAEDPRQVIGILSPHVEVLTFPARPEAEAEDGIRQRLGNPNRDQLQR